MAEEPSFAEIIERLKSEGDLLRNSGTDSIKSLKEINLLGFDVLVDQMGELIDFFKGNVLQEEENRRELLRILDSEKEEEKEEKPLESQKQNFLESIKESGILSFLASSIFNFTSGLLEGLITGYGRIYRALFEPFYRPFRVFFAFFQEFTKFPARFRLFQVRLTALNKALKEIFIFEKIQNTLRSSRTLFENLVLDLKIGFRFIFEKIQNTLRSARTVFENLVLDLKIAFRFIFEEIQFLSKRLAGVVFGKAGLQEIGSLFPEFKAAFGELSQALKNLPFFGRFFKIFGKVIFALKQFGPVFLKLGRVVGRTIPFLNLGFAIYDAFTGAFKALERVKDGSIFSKIFAVIIGAISGLVQGFAGQFLDLLKNILSWVFRKVGLGNVSDFLDSFSFTEIIKNFFDTIIDSFVNGFDRIISDFKNLSLGKAFYNLFIELIGMAFKLIRAVYTKFVLPFQMIAKLVSKFTGEDSLAGKIDRGLSLESSFDSIDKFTEYLRIDNPNITKVERNNTSGAQMEVGMSNIADAKSQPAQVFVSGSSSPQTVNTNNSSVTINDNGHREESSFIYQPALVGGY